MEQGLGRGKVEGTVGFDHVAYDPLHNTTIVEPSATLSTLTESLTECISLF